MKIVKQLSKITRPALLILSVIIVSCKKDDPEPVDTNPIVGSWQYVSVAPEAPGTTIPLLGQITTYAPCISSLVFKFNSNNTLTAENCDVAVLAMGAAGLTIGAETKWKVEGTKLKLTNGTTVKEFPITQQTSQMTITVNTNSDTTTPAVNAVITVKRI